MLDLGAATQGREGDAMRRRMTAILTNYTARKSLVRSKERTLWL